MTPNLTVLGHVESTITELKNSPMQGDEGGATTTVVIDKPYDAALAGIGPGQDILLFTWLDKADRERLVTHPRKDFERPPTGVFSQRSPHRPNPIGLHRVRVLDMEYNTLTVAPLEVVDGTPVIDIKPVLDRELLPVAMGSGRAVSGLLAVGRRAWDRGLVSGFNGNFSARLAVPDGERVYITGSGCQKGLLSPEHVAVLDLASGQTLSGPMCSTEAPLHLEIYRRTPEAKAIAHVHPPHLLAASLKFGPQRMLDLPLYEAGVFAAHLAVAPALEPGTDELALAAAELAMGKRAVFLERHGLVCWGSDLWDALGLAEELENLARIALLAGCN